MKLLNLLAVFIFISNISIAQTKQQNPWKVEIKTPIVLSSNDTLRVGDIIEFSKTDNSQGTFKFVMSRTSSNGIPTTPINRKYVINKQKIKHFIFHDGIFYAITHNYCIAVESAFKSNEIVCTTIKNITPIKENNTPPEITSTSTTNNNKLTKSHTYSVKRLTELDFNSNITVDELKNNPNLLEAYNIRYNLQKYYKTRRTAICIGGAGIILGTIGGITFDENFGKAATIVGGGLGIASIVTFVVAEKWLKYSSIKPILNGDQVGLTITF